MSVCARKIKKKINEGEVGIEGLREDKTSERLRKMTRKMKRRERIIQNLAMSARRLFLVPPGHAAMRVTFFVG
jgi:hypothetical protein